MDEEVLEFVKRMERFGIEVDSLERFGAFHIVPHGVML